MWCELFIAAIIIAVAFLLLFKSKLPARWKYLVLQTVTGGLLLWLLAFGWIAFSGLLVPRVGPTPVHTTLEQTRVSSLLQLMSKHPRAIFYVAPAGLPQTFEVKGEVADRNTNLSVNVTAYIDSARHGCDARLDQRAGRFRASIPDPDNPVRGGIYGGVWSIHHRPGLPHGLCSIQRRHRLPQPRFSKA